MQKCLLEGPSGEVMFKLRYEYQREVSQPGNWQEGEHFMQRAPGWKEHGILWDLRY